MLTRPISLVVAVTLSVSFSLILSVHAASSDAAALSSASPSPAMSGITEKITKKEIRQIRRVFIETLDLERENLKRQQSRHRKEIEAERKSRKQVWTARENEARRKFFEEKTHGPDRRAYVTELNERRKDFLAALKREEKDNRAEAEARWRALQEDQRMRLNEVEAYLKRNERPSPPMLQSREM